MVVVCPRSPASCQGCGPIVAASIGTSAASLAAAVCDTPLVIGGVGFDQVPDLPFQVAEAAADGAEENVEPDQLRALQERTLAASKGTSTKATSSAICRAASAGDSAPLGSIRRYGAGGSASLDIGDDPRLRGSDTTRGRHRTG
jgi:hypothetical protein